MKNAHFVVIDPAVKTAEIDCFNHLAFHSPLPLTYHLPGLFNPLSLQQETHGVKGILVFGSATSVHDSLPWQTLLSKWLLPKLAAGIPVLGICYGHQLIAHLFGANVETKFPGDAKRLGLREIYLEKNALWGAATSGPLFVSHREVVADCPKEFQVVGRSEQVEIEALAHKQLPIWTFQSHPESTVAFTDQQGLLTEETKLAFGHALVNAFLKFAAERPLT